MRLVPLIVVGLAAAGCVGNTGGQTFTFPAAAAGPADATNPLAFSSNGFDVTLTKATLHIGALYLNQSAPVSGAQSTDCYLTGTYVGQVTCEQDVDLLAPGPQAFDCRGLGVTEPPALAQQVWLTGGDINDPSDTTPILTVAGTATSTSTSGAFPFTGTVTIGPNHAPSGTVTGGGDSICKQRIVSPVRQTITIAPTGGLLLRIDPRLFFVDVDFSQIPVDSTTGNHVFSDDPSAPGYAPTGQNLYGNLRSVAPYTFSWEGSL